MALLRDVLKYNRPFFRDPSLSSVFRADLESNIKFDGENIGLTFRSEFTLRVRQRRGTVPCARGGRVIHRCISFNGWPDTSQLRGWNEKFKPI